MYCPGCAQLTREYDTACAYCATPLSAIRQNFQGQSSQPATRLMLKKLGILTCSLTFIWPVLIAFLSEVSETLWGRELPLMDSLMILSAIFLMTGLAMLIYLRAIYPLPRREDSFFRQLTRRILGHKTADQPGRALISPITLVLPSGNLIATNLPTAANPTIYTFAEVNSAAANSFPSARHQSSATPAPIQDSFTDTSATELK